MQLQQGISAELNAARVGQTLKVLIDRPDGDRFIGRSEYDSPEVDNEVIVHGPDLTPGQFSKVRITAAEAYDLVGVVA